MPLIVLVVGGRADLMCALATVILRPWQQKLLDICDGPVVDHKIYWCNAGVAGGKSHMVEYLLKHRCAVCFRHGNLADIARGYNNERIVIFDLVYSPNPQGAYGHLYMAIDALQNGTTYSSNDKHTKFYDPPHVVVFNTQAERLPPRFEKYAAKYSSNARRIDHLFEDRKVMRAEFWEMQDKLCAFAMCVHTRLGTMSSASMLDNQTVSLIGFSELAKYWVLLKSWQEYEDREQSGFDVYSESSQKRSVEQLH